jgi:hypothetical protein
MFASSQKSIFCFRVNAYPKSIHLSQGDFGLPIGLIDDLRNWKIIDLWL